MANKVTKTEHSGAKNGGGYWGLRVDAKEGSKKRRRSDGQKLVSEHIGADGEQLCENCGMRLIDHEKCTECNESVCDHEETDCAHPGCHVVLHAESCATWGGPDILPYFSTHADDAEVEEE